MKSKIEKNLEQFKDIVKTSKTIKEVNDRMGYKLNGNTYRFLKSKMDQFGIDYSHIISVKKDISVDDVKKMVPSSTSMRNLIINLKLNPENNNYRRKLTKIINEHKIDISHFTGAGWSLGKSQFTDKRIAKQTKQCKMFANEEFSPSVHSKVIINQLVLEGYFEYKCSFCGIQEWENGPIRLQLDHIDGDHENNNLSNLRLLCPNCHSQTETFAAGKTKVKDIDKHTQWYYHIVNYRYNNLCFDF